MNAQFRWEFGKSIWWVVLGGIPVSLLFYFSTRFSYEYFGSYWAIRPLGFGIATIVFGTMTGIVLHEIPGIKIWVSLILALGIILLMSSNAIDKM
ncbi:MAG: hypothetical protein H8E03_00355 [Pelagibacteraceae bacterium]|nr:hypothetical protein [Pelagibacteraceae bacterium]